MNKKMAYGFPSTTLAKIEQVFKDDGLVNNETLTTHTINSYLVQYSSNNAPLCAFSFGDSCAAGGSLDDVPCLKIESEGIPPDHVG